jgi:hypothetical protein
MTSAAQPTILEHPVRVDRIVVMTITLMSALIIYDGWDRLRFVDVATIIVGPIVAIFASHVFAGDLAKRVELGRVLTRHERVTLIGRESRFLLLALPPLALLAVLTALGVSYTRTIQVIILAGIASLGFWGGLAGHRAGLTGWRFMLCVACGLGLGGLTLVLQAILQPGIDPFVP